MTFELDWEALAAHVPPLDGSLLRPGESTVVRVGVKLKGETYLSPEDDGTLELTYGFSDEEGGQLPTCFDDPDPPSDDKAFLRHPPSAAAVSERIHSALAAGRVDDARRLLEVFANCGC